MRTHFRAFIAALISGCAFTLCMSASAASAETKRFALLFGNGHYRHAAGLRDPAADVTDLSASLARAGYTVRVLVDADYGSMRAALRDYARQADGADAAIVYFAGYGMEMNGENWLIPSDAELRSESAVENEAVSLKSVVSSVSNVQSFGLVVLDAARANPFDADMKKGKDGRTVARGLVGVEAPDNVFVAQSAKEGEVAPDGTGRLSPFTAALVSRIGEPGLQLEYLFRDVGEEVAATTGGAQAPTLYGDSSDKPAYVVPAGETVAQGPPIAADQIAWSFLEGTNDVASLHAFSEAFPDSAKHGQASARISALEGGMASPVLAVAVDTDPVAEAPLLLAKGVGTAEDAAKLARRFKGDTAEVKKAWAVIAKVGNAKVANAFQSLFPGVARRTVHAAHRPSQAARVASARRMPFRVAHRAPVHSILPVFVVRPRVTNNPLVALRDNAYAGVRPSPIKRVAVRERDCEARRWYQDIRQDFDDCGVPWGAEGRSDGPVALYNPQAFEGGRYANRDLNMAAGLIGPEPTGAGSPANGQPSTAPAQGSNNPAVPDSGNMSANAGTGSGSPPAGNPQTTAVIAASPIPASPSSAQPTMPNPVPQFALPSTADAAATKTLPQAHLLHQDNPFEAKSGPAVAGREVPVAASSDGSLAPSSNGSTGGKPVTVPAGTTSTASKSPTDETTKASGKTASTDTTAKAPGGTTATTSGTKPPASETAKAPGGSSAPSTSASTGSGSTDTTAKAAGGGTTTGTAPTTTVATTVESPSKAAGEIASGATSASPTGGKPVDTIVATTSPTAPSTGTPATTTQASPTSGTTAVAPTAVSEVPPVSVSTGPVIAPAPTVVTPTAVVSTGSPATSGAPKSTVPTVSASGPAAAPASGALSGSTALSASVQPTQAAPSETSAPVQQVSHVPSHRPSTLPAQPARSTAALSAPGPTTRPTPAAARPDSPVRTAAIRTIPHLVGAVHDPAEHRAAADRTVRAPARAIPVAPVHLRPTFLVLHQLPRREMAPPRPTAILQPVIRTVQRIAPPVRFAPPVQRFEMPRVVRPVVPQIQRIAIPQVQRIAIPQIQRIAVPQIQRIAVPQIQRIVIPTIGAAQIARPMMPMIRRPGQ